MVDIALQELECKRCGYKWVPRIKKVRICPKCKSPYWDVEKRVVGKGRNDGVA